MASETRSRNVVFVLAAFLLFVSFLVLASPPPASAITVTAPVNILLKCDVRANLATDEPGGLAVLSVDGTAVRTAEVTGPGEPREIVFANVSFKPGPHTVRVAVRNRTGARVAAGSTQLACWQTPVPPILVSPSNGYAARVSPVVVRVGLSTTSLTLYFNGKRISTRSVRPSTIVNLGTFTYAAGMNTIQIEASNPVSARTGTWKVRRLDFPWPTCIIIDKSEFRLYWVKDGVLVKTYPIAIGKPSTPTPARDWRVGEKLYEHLGGVYGPRRLRLYKQVGPSSFVWTGYGVHGTNQEWVIGTMASHGCIRLYNRDIMELWPQVPLRTMVRTRE